MFREEFPDQLEHIIGHSTTTQDSNIKHEQITINEFLVEIWIYENRGEIQIDYGYPIEKTFCGSGWCTTKKMIDGNKGRRSFVFKINGKTATLKNARFTQGRLIAPIYKLLNNDILVLNKVSEKLQNTFGITLDYSSFTIKPEPGPKPTPKPIAEPEKKKDNTILWLIFGALLVFIFMKKR